MLRPDPEHERPADAVLMHFGHCDTCVANSYSAVAARKSAVKAYEIHRGRADEVGNEHALRPVVDLLRRSDLFNDPVVHDKDLVGHRHRLELVMSDIDCRRPDPVVKITKFVGHSLPEFGVERAERFVHEKSLRPAHNGAAQSDALPVAPGKSRNLTG